MATENLGDRAIVVSAPKQDLVRQLGNTIKGRCGEDAVGLYYTEAKEAARRIVVTCNRSLSAIAKELEAAGRRTALFMADECHSTESESMKEGYAVLNPLLTCGFTATPFRSLPKEMLSIFKEIVVRYTMADALRDKVLVPMRHVRYRGEHPGTVDEECLEMMRAEGGGPGIVDSNSIADAERYAAWLCDQGFSAMPIHSKMNALERARRLEILQEGGVRCLVHVSLLSEGVDMPWLRWLCMRRKTEARVRFLQHLGRVLRVHPGKTEGVVMDPHLLLGRHGLTSAEAIGVAMEQMALAIEREEEARNEQGLTEAQVIALDGLLFHLGLLRDAMRTREIIEKDRYVSEDGDGWKMAGVTQKQVDRLASLRKLTRHIPKEHRDPVKALVHVPWALSRGGASDLIDVLIGGAAWARGHAHGRDPFMVQWPASWVRLDAPDVVWTKAVDKIKVNKEETS